MRTTEPRNDDSLSGAELIHSEFAVCVKSGALLGAAAVLIPQTATNSAAARPADLRCMLMRGSVLQHLRVTGIDPNSGRILEHHS
jgi:hypothetical protein